MNAKDSRKLDKYRQDYMNAEKTIRTVYKTMLNDESHPPFEKRAAYQIIAHVMSFAEPFHDSDFFSDVYIGEDGLYHFPGGSLERIILRSHRISDSIFQSRWREFKMPIDLLHDLQSEIDCVYGVADEHLIEATKYINEIIEKLENIESI